jgi:hypothetical protein
MEDGGRVSLGIVVDCLKYDSDSPSKASTFAIPLSRDKISYKTLT